jgi:hypothetical protein
MHLEQGRIMSEWGRLRAPIGATVVGAIALALGACAGGNKIDDSDRMNRSSAERNQMSHIGGRNQPTDEGGIFGPGGLFGSKAPQSEGTGLAVNAYLWRASLDTLRFLPLANADPFGGTILYDWYTPAESPTERIKVTVLILDRDLRADGLRVGVQRQQQAGARGWVDVPTDPKTAMDLENAILTTARQLRIAQTGR